MPLGHDARVAVRGLLLTPGQALLVALTLGLAIGANSATSTSGAFSVNPAVLNCAPSHAPPDCSRRASA